jgi:hypothetical protein
MLTSSPAAAAPPSGEGRVRRDRKQVEFFQVEAKKEEEFVIPEGKGTKLRDIPNGKSEADHMAGAMA